MKLRTVLLGLLLGIFLAASAHATPTTITVRVISKGAKFVGTSMGGAMVVVKNAQTGEILDKGATQGTTGNTEKIMKAQQKHWAPVSDEKSAEFTASIDIDSPTYIEVTAWGPLCQRQAVNTVSATQWVIPGKHITGPHAWMMTLPGMVVDILSPPTHVKLKGVPQSVKIEANVAMM